MLPKTLKNNQPNLFHSPLSPGSLHSKKPLTNHISKLKYFITTKPYTFCNTFKFIFSKNIYRYIPYNWVIFRCIACDDFGIIFFKNYIFNIVQWVFNPPMQPNSLIKILCISIRTWYKISYILGNMFISFCSSMNLYNLIDSFPFFG